MKAVTTFNGMGVTGQGKVSASAITYYSYALIYVALCCISIAAFGELAPIS